MRLHDSDSDDCLVDESHQKPEYDKHDPPSGDTYFEELPNWVYTTRLYHAFMTTGQSGLVQLPRQAKADAQGQITRQLKAQQYTRKSNAERDGKEATQKADKVPKEKPSLQKNNT